jgi:transposase
MQAQVQGQRGIIVGVDTHKDSHTVSIIDERGGRIAQRKFEATATGYRQALSWMSGHGTITRIGIECTGSYGAGLTRACVDAGLEVLEVVPERRKGTRRARTPKSDPIDAWKAASCALSGERCVPAKDMGDALLGLSALLAAYKSAVRERTAALNALHGLIVRAPDKLRDRLRGLKGARLVDTCATFRVPPAHLDGTSSFKRALRLVARRVKELGTEAAGCLAQIDILTSSLIPCTRALQGAGPITAATLLIAAGGDMGRFSSEPAFAMLCGVAPIPASSGMNQHMRLNHGGDRQANCALHTMALVRERMDERTQAFIWNKMHTGDSPKTRKGALRCLKRYICREVHGALKADLAAWALEPGTAN